MAAEQVNTKHVTSLNKFKETKMDYSSAIGASEYSKGGIIDTPNLTELPNDFKSAFLSSSDLIHHDQEINRVLILYNPISGGGLAKKMVKQYIEPKFESCQIETNILVSKKPKFITNYLINSKNEILSLKINAFIVVGGDGTYHEFVNGYIAGNWLKENIPVLFCFGGTGNSLCLNIGIDDELKSKQMIDKLCKYIQINKAITIKYMDCIQLTALKNDSNVVIDDNDNDEKEEKKEDLNVNDGSHLIYACSQTYWGIPAATAKTAESLRIFGGYRYDISALYQIIRKDSRKLKLTFYFDDDKDIMVIDTDVSVLVVQKNKYFGKGLMITPLAKLDSCYLDVSILPNASRRHTLGLFSLVPKGTHILKTSTKNGPYYFRCKKLKVEPYDGYHDEIGIDGEQGPNTPFTINVVPKAIPMIYF